MLDKNELEDLRLVYRQIKGSPDLLIQFAAANGKSIRDAFEGCVDQLKVIDEELLESEKLADV